jgi:hypothetical protein
VDDLQTHARTALEQLCARGDLDRARDLYAEDFVDHVNALEFYGQAGIARSVALYRAIFPDLQIRVPTRPRAATASPRAGSRTARTRAAPSPCPITLSRFENGKIAEDWTVSDNLDLLRRLGVRRGLALAARHLAGRLPGSR